MANQLDTPMLKEVSDHVSEILAILKKNDEAYKNEFKKLREDNAETKHQLEFTSKENEALREEFRETKNLLELAAKENQALSEKFSEFKHNIDHDLPKTVLKMTVGLLGHCDSNASSMESNRPIGELRKCYSCKTMYDPIKKEKEACYFHPFVGTSFTIWKDWPVGQVFDVSYQDYFYWPCCNLMAKGRPKGCLTAWHHEAWDYDIVRQCFIKMDKNSMKNLSDGDYQRQAKLQS